MTRARELANFADNTAGLETLTVSDITDLTATATELNKLDGVTASTEELNKLTGVTADTNELNLLDGVTATTAELNYTDGVSSALQTQIDAKPSASIFVGMIAPFGMSSVPTGWLACDGSAVSRTTYADLFTAIGTTWGAGDGSSTFALPDLEGAFLRGVGAHNTSNKANGNDFGDVNRAVGSFENDQIQDMRSYTDGSANGYSFSGSSSNYSSYNVPWVSSLGGNWVADGFIENGQGTPRVGDETRPFNAGVKYCIKY